MKRILNYALVSKVILLQVLVKSAISCVLVILGLALIFVKHPSLAFEIAIVYRYSRYHGITIMDINAVLIILSGCYLFLNAALQALRLWESENDRLKTNIDSKSEL